MKKDIILENKELTKFNRILKRLEKDIKDYKRKRFKRDVKLREILKKVLEHKENWRYGIQEALKLLENEE
jgi:hypothetical protein